jgi:ribonuclease BN (tRNA processing enzyme)
MTPKNKLLDELSTENVEVYGKELLDGIYDIESIEIYEDLSEENISSLAYGIAEKLNESNDAAGKNWMVLENSSNYSLIVSGIFDKNESKYKSFGIQVDDDGLVFKVYEHDKEAKVIYRKNSKTKMLKNQTEGLIKVLGDINK